MTPPRSSPLARRALHGAVLLSLLSLVGPAVAGAPEEAEDTPQLRDPFPFDHGIHQDALRSAHLACTDCHPVGLARVTEKGPAAPEEAVEPPRASCHGCHLGELDHAPRAAPSTCASCHADLTELTPPDHGPGWMQAHAATARAGAGSCRDCHDTAWCFACHDDRGPLAENPHDPGFRITHGVEARLDPRSCSSCHAGTSCTECHETGSSPW